MEAFDYAMALVSIVVGLAIGDLATSLQKLIRHRRTVRWDPRALLAATFTFVVIFSMWYELWGVRTLPAILTYPFLFSLVVELIILFLMATTVLPDEAAANLDLGEFYENNARSVWALFLLFETSYVSHWLYFMLIQGVPIDHVLGGLTELLIAPAVGVALALTPRKRWLHIVAMIALLALWLWKYARSSIAA